VLVPRPETELVVERALAHLPADRDLDVLDLASGSGAIALAVASERPRCRVVATDVAAAAVEATRENALRLQLGDRVAVLQGAWFDPFAGRRFDLIASNPPYIAADDARVEPGVRRYEPAEALFSGPTGLEALQIIAAGAPVHLRTGGWLVVEHGDTQGAAVRALFTAAGFEEVHTFRDLSGLERCTEGRLRG
jgi:release factor glutamine methyltransferase